jgi:hypothetical protein
MTILTYIHNHDKETAPALGAKSCSVCAYCPLHVMKISCWSWAPLKAGLCLGSHWSPLTVSCTIIHSCVLCGNRAQLQGELVLGRVSGDGDVALEGWAVVSVNIIFYLPQQFQALPWGPVEPSPVVATVNGVNWDSTGKGRVCEGFIRLGLDSCSCTCERTFESKTVSHEFKCSIAMSSLWIPETRTSGSHKQDKERSKCVPCSYGWCLWLQENILMFRIAWI